MLERVKEIRERIRDDRVRYRDSVLRLTESHIVMNALWVLEALEKENEELKARLDKAVELPFFQKDGEVIVLIYKDKDGIVFIEKYIEDEYYNGKRGNVAAEARLKEIEEEIWNTPKY